MTEEETFTSWSLTHIDLLNERYRGQAIACNDEFFANASNLVKRTEPVYLSNEYTDRGKWMDGWETRRRRTAGHDWCILRLGIPGVIRAFNVNTTFFKGNAPEAVVIEACSCETDPTENTLWQPLLEKTPVNAHDNNFFEIANEHIWTHLRLNIYPDGGVARLRAWGEPQTDWTTLIPNELVDVASSVYGGRAIACSDMFFSPMNNLIAPGRSVNMSDGWETRRRRGPGHDWVVVQLACAAKIARVVLDTRHFKGNFPESFTLEGAYFEKNMNRFDDETVFNAMEWVPLVSRTKLTAHTEHFIQEDLLNTDALITHVRLNIYPDGGVARLRVMGYPDLSKL